MTGTVGTRRQDAGTGCANTFIAVAEDCRATGEVPDRLAADPGLTQPRAVRSRRA